MSGSGVRAGAYAESMSLEMGHPLDDSRILQAGRETRKIDGFDKLRWDLLQLTAIGRNRSTSFAAVCSSWSTSLGLAP
eukprot:761937-Hanusia_phi.AAC.7